MLSHFLFAYFPALPPSTTFLYSSTLPEHALNTFVAVFFSPHLVTLPYHLEVCASLPSSTSIFFHPAFAFTLFHIFFFPKPSWYCCDTFSPPLKSTISFRLHPLHTVRHSFVPLPRGDGLKRFCGMTHKLYTNTSWSLFHNSIKYIMWSLFSLQWYLNHYLGHAARLLTLS